MIPSLQSVKFNREVWSGENCRKQHNIIYIMPARLTFGFPNITYPSLLIRQLYLGIIAAQINLQKNIRN